MPFPFPALTALVTSLSAAATSPGTAAVAAVRNGWTKAARVLEHVVSKWPERSRRPRAAAMDMVAVTGQARDSSTVLPVP